MDKGSDIGCGIYLGLSRGDLTYGGVHDAMHLRKKGREARNSDIVGEEVAN